jgi:lysophospholipase L1-like esterase
MKCLRFSRIVALLAVSTALLSAVAVAKDTKSNLAVVPSERTDGKMPERQASINARIKQGNVDLIFIGDSITQGWEYTGKKTWERYYAKRNAANLGVSGDKTQNVLWRLDHGNLDGISPKLAVIMIGTNNAGHKPSPSPEDIADGVKAIVDRLRTKLPETKILLLGIFPRGANDQDPVRQITMKVNQILAKWDDGKTLFYLDIGPKFLNSDGSPNKNIRAADSLHLEPEGYDTWAEAIEPMVSKLLGQPAVASAPKEAKQPRTTTPAPRPDEWWKTRQEAVNARIAQGNVDLLFIGDSITHSWEGAGKEVWQKYYGKRNAANAGFGGDGTQHVLWRLDHGNIDGISPKLAVVMIGTNNAAHAPGDSPEDIAAGVKAIVAKLRAKLPQTRILLLAIFPRGANKTDHARQVNTAANNLISRLANGKNVFYLDIGLEFLNPDGTLPKDVMPDLLHPNAKGYQIWADAIEPTVQALMDTSSEHVNPAVVAIPYPYSSMKQRDNDINAHIKQGNVDLMFLGDSISHDWEGHGKDVWQKYYGNRNAVNMGNMGDRTQFVLWRLDHGNLDGVSPKLIVVQIGTNNAGSEQPPQEIADGVKAVIDKVRTKLPEAKILLMGLFPRSDKKIPQQLVPKTNVLLAKLADGKTVFYMDIGEKLLNPDGTPNDNVRPDKLHLTAKGYETWAEAIEPIVEKFLGEKQPSTSPAPAKKAA